MEFILLPRPNTIYDYKKLKKSSIEINMNKKESYVPCKIPKQFILTIKTFGGRNYSSEKNYYILHKNNNFFACGTFSGEDGEGTHIHYYFDETQYNISYNNSIKYFKDIKSK